MTPRKVHPARSRAQGLRVCAAPEGSAALHLYLLEQLQCLFIIPCLEQFTDLIQMAVDQEEVIGGRATAAAGFLAKIVPEGVISLGLLDVPMDHRHQTTGVPRAINVVKTDIAIRLW